MAHSDAFSITIRVPTGSPGGLRIIEKPNWSGIGFMFPRDDFRQEDVQQQVAMSNPGVYVLWGDNDDGEQRIYIGVADSVVERLRTHVSSEQHTFWNETIVFTSKDRSVNSTHARFVESDLVRIAKQVDYRKVANDQNPGKPNLPENDTITARSFLDHSLSCMGIVGIPFFRETPTSSQGSDILPSNPLPDSAYLYLRGGGQRGEVKATGYRDGKELVVLATAQAAKEEVQSASTQIRGNRRILIDDGHFVDRGDYYELLNDFRFSSPSAAAQALLGRASNGRIEWKNNADKSLGEMEADS